MLRYFLFCFFLLVNVLPASAKVFSIDNLVRITDIDPTIVIDLRYASDNNFTHHAIYSDSVGLLREETANKLAKANREFLKSGYRIKVWDAYRPLSVQRILWDIIPDDRYVANPYKGGSRHNKGGAVDITLVGADGQELEMPSGFDDFSSRAWPNNFALSTKVRKNLDYLRKVMFSSGFVPIENEWWHFDDADWRLFSLVDVMFESFLETPVILNNEALNSANQVLIVEENGLFKAKVSTWERSNHVWKPVFPFMNAVIGRNGFAQVDKKREGDGKTPSGIFMLKRAFGYNEKLDTKLEYKQVSANDVWVDDAQSKDYNLWRQLKDESGVKSYEILKRNDDLYEAAAVIEYNTEPVTAGLGSAIFLHIWRGPNQPTAGCVALSKYNLYRILKWLDIANHPMLVINFKEGIQ